MKFELAWAAGFFDGEGTTYLRRWTDAKRNPQIAMCVAQNDIRPLERFKEAVGVGKIYGPFAYRKGENPRWQWQTSKRENVGDVIWALWPHLSEPKQEQIVRKLHEFKGDDSN